MGPFSLHDKTILVTGASSGIGRQIAITITEMGGSVIITGRNEKRLLETMDLLKSGKNHYVAADLTSSDEIASLIKNIEALDGVANSAGTVQPFPVKFLSKEKIKETFSINYDSQVDLMAQLTRQKKLKRNASVVFLSSISASHPHKGGAVYAGSKAAIEAFSKVIALEFFPQGIRSNCLIAAMVKTPMYEYSEQNASKETMDEHVNKYPLGVGEPSDVANAAVFLLSDASKWITGTTITLDGGFLLGGL